MTARQLLRMVGELQRTERDAMRQVDEIEAVACQAEALGYTAWGAALRAVADAIVEADRESTRAGVARLHEALQGRGS